MIEIIIKAIFILTITNIFELAILILSGVHKKFFCNVILNNILGTIFLLVLYLFNIFIAKISTHYLIITSTTGIVGLIGILIKCIIKQ